jgi:hypothetical protein
MAITKKYKCVRIAERFKCDTTLNLYTSGNNQSLSSPYNIYRRKNLLMVYMDRRGNSARSGVYSYSSCTTIRLSDDRHNCLRLVDQWLRKACRCWNQNRLEEHGLWRNCQCAMDSVNLQDLTRNNCTGWYVCHESSLEVSRRVFDILKDKNKHQTCHNFIIYFSRGLYNCWTYGSFVPSPAAWSLRHMNIKRDLRWITQWTPKSLFSDNVLESKIQSLDAVKVVPVLYVTYIGYTSFSSKMFSYRRKKTVC